MIRRGLVIGLALVLLISMSACGGGGSTQNDPPPQQPVSISVSPAAPSVEISKTQQFTATVLNATNNAVIWQVNDVEGGNATVGTISTAGLYTAPASVPSPATVTVKAISQQDTSKSATATVTVVLPVSVSVAPGTATVHAGEKQQFTSTVSNATNTAVTWSVVGGSANGTIDATGTYTAPATVPNPATVTVKATSSADSTKSATATVTVVPAVVVSVSPATANVQEGKTQQFAATVTGATDTGVTWTVVGGSANGTIDANGLYTAPAAAPNPATVTVKATSNADSTKSGTATVTVTVVAVSVSPATANVQEGKTQQFAATVTGTTNTAVTWTVVGGDANGTINANGLYTAPAAAPAPATVTVKATSAADATKSGTATVTVTTVAVTVAPATADVPVNTTQQYTATVTGTTNTAVTWSVVGGDVNGMIDANGLYTAPAAIPASLPVHVKATSVADPTKSGTAQLNVMPPPPVSISVAPTAATVIVNQTKQFTATVLNTSNTAVTWQVNGVTGGDATSGTISATGLFTAPASVPAPGSVAIKAISQADNTKFATAKATVIAAPTRVDVSLTPGATGTGSLNIGSATLNFSFSATAVDQQTTVTIESIAIESLPIQSPSGTYVAAFQLTMTGDTQFSVPVTISGLAPASITAGTTLNLAMLQNGAWVNIGTLTVDSGGNITANLRSVALPGLTAQGTYLVYAPAPGTSTAISNLGIALFGSELQNVVYNKMRVVRLYDASGNLRIPPAVETVEFGQQPVPKYIGGIGLTPDGSKGVFGDPFDGFLHFFSGTQTGTTTPGSALNASYFYANSLGLNFMPIAMLPNGDAIVGGTKNGVTYLSGVGSGNPVLSEYITYYDCYGCYGGVGLVISNDGKVMLTRTDASVRAFKIQPITPRAGTVAGTVSYSFTQTSNLGAFNGHPNEGRGGMAISPTDSSRAIILDLTNTPKLYLVTGLPDNPVASTPVTTPDGVFFVNSVAITPDGKSAIVGAQTGMLMYSGVDTGNLTLVNRVGSGAYWSAGVTLDGKYALGCDGYWNTLDVFPITSSGIENKVTGATVYCPTNDTMVVH